MSKFKIVQMRNWRDNKIVDKFELVIKDDLWWRARAIIYGDWIAEKLAKELGIKVEYAINREVKAID